MEPDGRGLVDGIEAFYCRLYTAQCGISFSAGVLDRRKQSNEIRVVLQFGRGARGNPLGDFARFG